MQQKEHKLSGRSVQRQLFPPHPEAAGSASSTLSFYFYTRGMVTLLQ